MSASALAGKLCLGGFSVAALVCTKVAFSILPIAQVAIGVIYQHDCPVQKWIPIYLIVSGVFGLVLGLLACLPCFQKKDGESSSLSCLCSIWNGLTSTFLFCWFIAGNVWIYSIYEPNYNKNSTTVTQVYCDKTLYLFAFWTTTLVYILFGVFLFLICCMFCCRCFSSAEEPNAA